jgi:precorrin-2 dehydrogenase/sirohydrochlorin ferrochelatase
MADSRYHQKRALMSLFPIFLKLTGRPCVVIGAGHLAESKIASLRAADASITVIAPEAADSIAGQAAAGELTLHQRPYQQGDLAGAFLVVAATNDPAVNRAVFAEAAASGVLCNAVDDPPFCDFYFPSIVRRGDLQIAISTAGNSPALAQQLRKELNEQLPLDLGDWLADLGNLRREVVAAEPLNESRRLLLHELAQRQVCSYDQCPSRLLARAHAITNPAYARTNPLPTEKT